MADNTCEYCEPSSAVSGTIGQVEDHKRSVHPMEYTIAAKIAAGKVLSESEKQFVEEAEAKAAAAQANADKAAAAAKKETE